MEGTLVAGRYRIEARIGEGGLARVYRATDTALDRTVAVKVLRETYSNDPEALARFRSEARAAAKLNHPNIVQVYDTGSADGLHYIVMEYLPEPDLKRIIERYGRLPARKVIEVAVQCCRALGAAHRAGMVHRDVKPHNILFTDDGIAKLSDFGIAAAAGFESLSSSGMVLGSANYISPEQAQGKPVGPQSDIYSLGCIIYEALTGQPPFQGASASEIAAMHVQQRPVAPHIINPSVTPSEEFVISKAMAKDPARRYQTAEEMLADLEKLEAGEDLGRTGVLRPSREATMPLYPAQAPPAPQVSVPRAVPRPAPQPEPVPQALSGWTIAGIVVLMIVALVVTFWLAQRAFYSEPEGKQIAVPAVTGVTEEEARQRLASVDLTVGGVSFERTDTARPGTVIRQSPEAGTMVPAGRAVSLVIAQGRETAQVVSVIGLPLAQADERLRRADLTLGEVTEVFSREPAGTVIAQLISPGTEVNKGTSVAVKVSKGPEQPPANTIVGPEPEEPPPSPSALAAVELGPDRGYQATDPAVTRWIVRVTLLGEQPGRKVDVFYSDERKQEKVQVANQTMDPGDSREWKILSRGATSVEVQVDGVTVFRETREPPEGPITP